MSKVSYLDGCKVYFEDGSFVICRPSGTEPVLRLMAEAKTEAACISYIQGFEAII